MISIMGRDSHYVKFPACFDLMTIALFSLIKSAGSLGEIFCIQFKCDTVVVILRNQIASLVTKVASR